MTDPDAPSPDRPAGRPSVPSGTPEDRTGDPAHTRGDTVERPLLRIPADEEDPERETATPGPVAERSTPPEAHPVAVPLAGFFTGMLYVLVLPVLYVWLSDPDSLGDLVSVDLAWGIVAILVPVLLTALPQTRKFGRYMLIGVLLSAVVVVGVSALVLAFLIFTGA